ncbi:MAG: alginate lyase family protein [Anaerolineaceae bacterium]|nr:alginate lyase family protein [Anaerolineaceae bacterium]
MKLTKKTYYLLKELGGRSLFLYGVYRLALKSGFFQAIGRPKQRPANPHIKPSERFSGFGISFPESNALQNLFPENIHEVLEEAENILGSRFRPYGGNIDKINLCPPISQHWSRISDKPAQGADIKDTWEPARFAWIYPLCRAYAFTGDEKYPEKFWQLAEEFIHCNPINRGANWASAQEVAIRIIAFTFAGCILLRSPASSEERLNLLLDSVFEHASRIPLTLFYARAQNNNHLLVEAAGLLTAGILFFDLSVGQKWFQLGWKWFHSAITEQISDQGVYIQQSTNYHRLMLQTSAWVYQLSNQQNMPFPDKSLEKLSQAVLWLAAQIDILSGKAPNLGHNDGAYLMPLGGDFTDYRPTIQTVSRLFLGRSAFPAGHWDENSFWLGIPSASSSCPSLDLPIGSPAVHKLGSPITWATLRAEKFFGRPAHADQLHVDIWWHGKNIALDPGTYRYTAPPPFDNTLAGTSVHNTLNIEQQDQMVKAGRFLWLRRAQAEIVQNLPADTPHRVAAQHNGYHSLGFIHQRELCWDGQNTWEIIDQVIPETKHNHFCSFAIQWLLPDWPWTLTGQQLRIQLPFGAAAVAVHPVEGEITEITPQVVRAGELVAGHGDWQPFWGWTSPTYGQLSPALSFRIEFKARPPVKISSIWTLEENPS